jgi:Chaperone for flagella basal body P-ring formation
MKSKRSKALLGAAIFTGAFCGVPTNAMRIPRIELVREARATGTERIVVSREARPITVHEVFAAIHNALADTENSATAKLQVEDVLLQTQVLVGLGDAGLQVLRSDFDAGLKRGRFLLWPSKDPKVLPFIVAVRFAKNSPLDSLHALTEQTRISRKHDLLASHARKAKAEVLVSPGQQATLLLRSNALRMTADVIPLERGTMGQQVHVRVVDTGKIFSAQVDGRAHLQLNF